MRSDPFKNLPNNLVDIRLCFVSDLAGGGERQNESETGSVVIHVLSVSWFPVAKRLPPKPLQPLKNGVRDCSGPQGIKVAVFRVPRMWFSLQLQFLASFRKSIVTGIIALRDS